jgi:hypothetical protein
LSRGSESWLKDIVMWLLWHRLSNNGILGLKRSRWNIGINPFFRAFKKSESVCLKDELVPTLDSAQFPIKYWTWKPCSTGWRPNIGFDPVFLYVYENLNLGNRAELYLVPILASTQFSYMFMKIWILKTLLSCIMSQYWFQPGFLICLWKSQTWNPCSDVSCPNFGFNPDFLYCYENLYLENRAVLYNAPILLFHQNTF